MRALRGRVAVVTGAASGIGRALAERFAAEGMSVVLADIEEEPLAGVCEAMRTAGADVLGVRTDVADAASVEALAGAAVARFGAFHLICNNAGVGGHLGPSWETSLTDWRWVVDVNLFGVIHGIRTFVPALVAQAEGHVVNTASAAAWRAAPAMAPYAATKHAVLAISEALRAELRALGSPVGVTALCPGVTKSAIMTSTRNWPAHFGPEPVSPADPMTEATRTRLTEGVAAGVDPAETAFDLIQAILNDRFVATTHVDQLLGHASARLGYLQSD
jgi:NADP-dependent 3-hydroxy acid dehydrogenase YdfG